MVGAGTRKARAISSVERPPSVRSVRATCASSASAGWQHVKIRRSRSSGTDASSAAACSSRCRAISSCLRDQPRVPAQAVDRLVPRGGDQPAHWIRGRAGHGPLHHCRRDRLLERLLCHVEVAEEADQGGQDPPMFGAKDLLDAHGRLMGRLPHRAGGCSRCLDGSASFTLDVRSGVDPHLEFAAEHALAVEGHALGSVFATRGSFTGKSNELSRNRHPGWPSLEPPDLPCKQCRLWLDRLVASELDEAQQEKEADHHPRRIELESGHAELGARRTALGTI